VKVNQIPTKINHVLRNRLYRKLTTL